MGEETNSLDSEKLQILLHANECLNNRIMTSVRLYYDVGVVIASSVILLGIYSVVSEKYTLLLAIPILIALGEIFYLHLVHMVMKFEWYVIENIEVKFDTIESEILNIIREVGTFRNLINKDNASLNFHIKRWIPYLGGYIIFCISSLAINIGRTHNLNINPIDLGILKIGIIELRIIECSVIIYFLIFLVLITAIFLIHREYKKYSDKIQLLPKKQLKK